MTRRAKWAQLTFGDESHRRSLFSTSLKKFPVHYNFRAVLAGTAWILIMAHLQAVFFHAYYAGYMHLCEF